MYMAVGAVNITVFACFKLEIALSSNKYEIILCFLKFDQKPLERNSSPLPNRIKFVCY